MRWTRSWIIPLCPKYHCRRLPIMFIHYNLGKFIVRKTITQLLVQYILYVLGAVHILRNTILGSRKTPPPPCNIVINPSSLCPLKIHQADRYYQGRSKIVSGHFLLALILHNVNIPLESVNRESQHVCDQINQTLLAL